MASMKIGISREDPSLRQALESAFPSAVIIQKDINVSNTNIPEELAEFTLYVKIGSMYKLVNKSQLMNTLVFVAENEEVDVFILSAYDDNLGSRGPLREKDGYAYCKTYRAKGYDCAIYRCDLLAKHKKFTNCRKKCDEYELCTYTTWSNIYAVVNPKDEKEFLRNNMYKSQDYEEIAKSSIVISACLGTIAVFAIASIAVKNASSII